MSGDFMPPAAQFGRRAGFALPGVILVLTLLFVVSVPTLLTVQQQWKVSEAAIESAEAQEAAEAFTVDVMSAWDTSFYSLAVWQDTTFQQVSAEAAVDFTVTRTSPQLYLIEAHAQAQGSSIIYGSALTVRVGGFDLDPQASLTVVDGAKLGLGATVYGTDAIKPPDWPSSVCTGSTTRHMPGILAPDATSVGVDSGAGVYGSPAILGDASVGPNTLLEPAGAPYGDLAAEADHTFAGFNGTPLEGSCDPMDSNNWGSPNAPTGPCGDYFPIIHVQGDAVLNSGSSGQGILLVDGNLTLSGNLSYYGLIVVKGQLTLTGAANRVRGAVYARIAELSPGVSSTNPMIYNTSCTMDRVRAAHPEFGTGVHPVSSRSWIDLAGIE